ncbi:endonuclease III domain-containing protein [Enterobacteriaceae endosymbiont of Plateumaris braccata]|uniref:endonuclease III domain-containing protein n=1 Tax=Enterobacteriaceae endosymbiont of Plateumaris braccata TaxID=2675793 RepID=UPI00144A0B38|nr:endonuclease III [Enterobacteriaceae endosymbiont of Plateumaris braccata]QJC28076.1 endonuclease III [Enterobacteriaceae endosymbiont of Plateumaris braccata]
MNQNKRLKILKIFNQHYLKLKSELIFNSSFELLISLILSSKTNDEKVNAVTKKLFIIANNPYCMVNLGISKIKEYIRPLGLYNNKSKYLIQSSNILIKLYNGIIPNNRKDLESLPGVGRKISNIILNTIFKKLEIAVDTHVYKFCNRTKFVIGKNTYEIEKKLLKFVPNKYKLYCHNWFIFHSKNICKIKKPLCHICKIFYLCEFSLKNINKI